MQVFKCMPAETVSRFLNRIHNMQTLPCKALLYSVQWLDSQAQGCLSPTGSISPRPLAGPFQGLLFNWNHQDPNESSSMHKATCCQSSKGLPKAHERTDICASFSPILWVCSELSLSEFKGLCYQRSMHRASAEKQSPDWQCQSANCIVIG